MPTAWINASIFAPLLLADAVLFGDPSVIFPLVNIQAVTVSLRALAKFQTQPSTCTFKSELFSSCTFKSELSSKCLSIPSYPQQVPPFLKYPQQVVSNSELPSTSIFYAEFIPRCPNECDRYRAHSLLSSTCTSIQAAASIPNGLPSFYPPSIPSCPQRAPWWTNVPRCTQTRWPMCRDALKLDDLCAEMHSN